MLGKKLLLVLLGCGLLFACQKPLPSSERIDEAATVKSTQASRSNPQAAGQRKQVPLFIFAKSPYVLGDASAPLTILSFVDYTCANCARLHRLLKRLLEDAEFKKLVSVSYRQYPLRNFAVKPAKIALAAGLYGNDKFWAMSEKLFAADGELQDSNYLIAAKEIGLNADKFARDLVEKDSELSKALQQDIAMAAKVKKLGSPVGVFVDGHLYRGQITLENLKNFIRAVKAYKEKAAQNAAQKKADIKK